MSVCSGRCHAIEKLTIISKLTKKLRIKKYGQRKVPLVKTKLTYSDEYEDSIKDLQG